MFEPWTLGRAKTLLTNIDASSTGNCLKTASALTREFGKAGEQLFLDWCMTAPNWDEAWAVNAYRRADPSRAGMGLLVRIAKDGGF
jgi:hypothetical protein